MTMGSGDDAEVIGVAGDVRTGGLDAEAARTVYVPTSQWTYNFMTVLVKGCGFDSSIQDRPFPVQRKPLETTEILLAQWWRNDDLRHTAAHHVGFGPPEQLGGLLIPLGDASPTVHGQDRI
jgi:hypothetical protein